MKPGKFHSRILLNLAVVAGAAPLVFCTLDPQLSVCFAQGSLTPPGAPGETFKTLSQIEPRTAISSLPYTIANAGSYYVTTNLAGTQGIVVSNSNVTLDLNGFALLGAGSGIGVLVFDTRTNLVVRNGQIVGWGFEGIGAAFVNHARVDKVTVTDCGFGGIRLGDFAVVTDCSALRNGGAGGGTSGIGAGLGSAVRNCTVAQHKGSSSSGAGISVGAESEVLNCVVVSNQCANGFGINASGGATLIAGCKAGNNRGTNQTGISVSLKSTVRDCLADGNTGDGIQIGSDCLAQNNLCSRNDGVGILVSGFHSRVEGNHVSNNNGDGLRVATTNGVNLIIRNSALNDTYNIAPGNRDAQRINTASGFVSTDPWANLQ